MIAEKHMVDSSTMRVRHGYHMLEAQQEHEKPATNPAHTIVIPGQGWVTRVARAQGAYGCRCTDHIGKE